MGESMIFAFNILVKKVDDYWTAHCLELDIVTTAKTPEEVKVDILDLITAQLNYALGHENMKYFFHPAPEDVMREFKNCKKYIRSERQVRPKKESDYPVKPPPYLLISNSTDCFNSCHA